jgi:AbrB family looped-hinge helix DNA binding protein
MNAGRFIYGTDNVTSKVKLSSKFQIVIPRAAREALSLETGDDLLVLCKPDRIVIVPEPKSFTRRTAGLHRHVWLGAEAYLVDEREAW